MLKSMTGFGAAAGNVEGVEYSIEIKSVNNRYLKVSLRLPDLLSALEAKIEQTLRARLTRGSVSVGIRLKLADETAVYSVNQVALQNYVNQLRMIEADANPMMRIDLGALLQLPGVCNPPELGNIAEKTGEGVMALLNKAIDNMIEMRAVEGEALAADLISHAKQIETNLAGVAERTDAVIQAYHDRLQSRVDELLAKAKLHLDQETLAREVAIFAERCDIAEEISRLTQHLKEFVRMCELNEPVGRKLDFIAQEMLREANTIASKGSDAEIGRAVVDIKTAIDRIKEQAANVE